MCAHSVQNYERANEALHRLYTHKFLLCAEEQVSGTR